MEKETLLFASEPQYPSRAIAGSGDGLYHLTVDQYHRMIDAGIFRDGDRVELLGGLLVAKTVKSPPHIVATDLLGQILHRLVPADDFVSMQNPVTIPADDSEPEPDAKVVRGSPRDYAGRKPGPGDVVEVSDSSFAQDRAKAERYVRAGVPVYWIVDLNRRRLEVHTEPEETPERAAYRSIALLGPDEEVPLVLDGREAGRFAVREILP